MTRPSPWTPQLKGVRSFFETYARRGSRQALEAIPDPVPVGFAADGRLYA